MAILELPAPAQASRSTLDFWTFWTGQSLSNLGSALTQFALPLLVYQLTHSAFSLGLATAIAVAPYLLFGLVIGAWVDRLDRKRLMIVMDGLLALCMATLPVVSFLGLLSVWWIYGVSFVSTTLTIAFNTAQFAVVPSLVDQAQVATANGHVQASTSAASVLGPLLAGALLFLLPLSSLLLLDAASFLVSAGTLALIRTSFNAAQPRERASVRADVAEGLRFIWQHPVLRTLALFLPLLNLLSISTLSQIVVLAHVHFHAESWQVSAFYSAAGAGAVLSSLLAGPLRRQLSFSRLAFGTIAAAGLLTMLLALSPWYWLAVICWGLKTGMETLFSICNLSQRQALIPHHLLGRVIGSARVVSYSTIPLGALLGGLLLGWVGAAHIGQVYLGSGLLIVLLSLAFARTPLDQPSPALPDAPRSRLPTAGDRPRRSPLPVGRRDPAVHALLDQRAAHTHCPRCWCPLPLAAHFCGTCGAPQGHQGGADGNR